MKISEKEFVLRESISYFSNYYDVSSDSDCVYVKDKDFKGNIVTYSLSNKLVIAYGSNAVSYYVDDMEPKELLRLVIHSVESIFRICF